MMYLLLKIIRTSIEKLRWIRMRLMRCILEFRATPIKPSSSKCVIFLPHPDDEVFGMGGTIAAKVAAGAECKFILGTLGEKSHHECCPGIEGEVVINRRFEFYCALAALGISQPSVIELGLEDQGILTLNQGEYELVRNKLTELLLAFAPKEVYYPAYNDPNSDHIGLSKLCLDAIAQSKGEYQKFRYIVWGWFIPSNRFYKEIFDSKIIKVNTEVWNNKKQCAIAAYIRPSPAQCGNPYGGRLPSTLIEACSSSQEFFLS